MNQVYIDTLVSLIKKGAINPKTGQTFKVDDILNADYKTAVQAALAAQ